MLLPLQSRLRVLGFSGLLALLALPGIAQARGFSVLDPHFSFECSPLEAVGCTGLFAPHSGDGSEMDLLTNGERSFAARMDALRRAKRSIRIQTLIFTADESGLAIAQLLKQKKSEGLDVRVIVDGFSNPSPKTQTLYFDLKQHGIEVEGFEAAYTQWTLEVSASDPCRPNKRFHEKMFIIDGEEPDGVSILGGLNIANEYFRTGPKPKLRWRDQDMISRGPVVMDQVLAFDRNYDYFKELKDQRPDLFNPDTYWRGWNRLIRTLYSGVLSPLADEAGRPVFRYFTHKKISAIVRAAAERDPLLSFRPAEFRFFQNRPRFKETYLHQAYLDLIRSAQSEILIANAYFFPSQEILTALADAADRGVTVRLLTNSKKTNDVPAMSDGSRHTYFDLLHSPHSPSQKSRGLFEIYEWIGPKMGEGTLHAKFAVIDRKVAIIGSYNLDDRSHLLNSETAMVFDNPDLAGELTEQFMNQDLPKSHRITDAEARKFHNPKAIQRLRVKLSQILKPLL